MIENDIDSERILLLNKLEGLPVCDSRVVRMEEANGYFFDLSLKDGVRLTMSRYDDDRERGYVNVIIDDEPVIQDFMGVDDVIGSLQEFYS